MSGRYTKVDSQCSPVSKVGIFITWPVHVFSVVASPKEKLERINHSWFCGSSGPNPMNLFYPAEEKQTCLLGTQKQNMSDEQLKSCIWHQCKHLLAEAASWKDGQQTGKKDGRQMGEERKEKLELPWDCAVTFIRSWWAQNLKEK